MYAVCQVPVPVPVPSSHGKPTGTAFLISNRASNRFHQLYKSIVDYTHRAPYKINTAKVCQRCWFVWEKNVTCSLSVLHWEQNRREKGNTSMIYTMNRSVVLV